jgi:hypothetical protein
MFIYGTGRVYRSDRRLVRPLLVEVTELPFHSAMTRGGPAWKSKTKSRAVPGGTRMRVQNASSKRFRHLFPGPGWEPNRDHGAAGCKAGW